MPDHHVRSIQILLGHIPPNDNDPDRNDYYDVAMYLVVLHNYYLAHHNNPPVYRLQQSVLERGPSVEHDLDQVIMTGIDCNVTAWQLKPEVGLAITHAIFLVQHDLSHLDSVRLMPHVAPRPDPLFPAPFFLNSMNCMPTPEAVRQPSVFAELYRHRRNIFQHITETQLWVAFMPLLCNLLASAKNLDHYEQFQPGYFRGCFLAVQAHNHYMESKQAPESFFILTD